MTEGAQSSPQEDLARLRRTPNAMSAWQNAMQCLNNGRHALALPAYRHLVQHFSAVPQLWAELGTAAAGELDFDLAEQSFRRALELAPADCNLLVAVGIQYYQMRRLDQARACLQRAVAANPSAAHARLTLAAWQERSRQLDQAMESVDACLAQHSQEGQALYFRAFLLHRKDLNDQAETALRDMLKNEQSFSLETQANVNYLLGIILDATGRYAEALPFLGRGKTLRAQTINAAAMEQIFQNVDQRRREALAELTPDTLARWRDQESEPAKGRRLCLLAGAPRSGTTLVEQIMGAHPDVLVFDELQSFTKELLGPLHQPPPKPWITIHSLDEVPADIMAKLTGRYFKSLLREAPEDPGAKLLLDKNPSTTAWLHVWLRAFPRLKIVVALRDPRDVIISSYFQNMTASWAIVSFMTLERAARFYSDCMDVWLRVRDMGGFDWIETRYEDVVKDLESEGRRLDSFLGLPWHEKQAAYYENARRTFVNAPTYDEVTKPVYTRAIRRWEHYAEALEPLRGTLAKYCDCFGYDK